MVTTPFSSFAFNASGGSTPRTMPARLGEIVNVKDCGATGNGSTDDAGAIQAAFDAAFGTSGSPHGDTNKYLNKPVFFPVGNYKVNSGLTLTQVSGGHIFGCGSQSTTIFYGGGSSGLYLITTNGMINSRIERLGISAGASNNGIDLDWNGSGAVGLKSNTLSDMSINGAIGLRLANSGNDGANNVFVNCAFNGCATVGLKVVGATALGQTFISGGAADGGIGIQVVDGSITEMLGTSFAGNSTCDIKLDNAAYTSVDAARSESVNFIVAVGNVRIAGATHVGSAGTFLAMTTPAHVICDGSYVASGKVITSSGAPDLSKLYLRGNNFLDAGYLTGFGGTVVQNI